METRWQVGLPGTKTGPYCLLELLKIDSVLGLIARLCFIVPLCIAYWRSDGAFSTLREVLHSPQAQVSNEPSLAIEDWLRELFCFSRLVT
jgi:hypothetical protein